jgi:hypothetical protein
MPPNLHKLQLPLEIPYLVLKMMFKGEEETQKRSKDSKIIKIILQNKEAN